jgi:protein-S-isoprenylcysteine O-methyltransferase Ste14
MRNGLITLLAIILVPGTAVVLIPYWILQATGGQPSSPPGFVEAAAAVLALVGAAMVVCFCDVRTRPRHSGSAEPPRAFVAEGLSRFLRNPMYFGALLVLFAESILFPSRGSCTPVSSAAPARLARSDRRAAAERRFGDPYRQYRSRTPRWVPEDPRAESVSTPSGSGLCASAHLRGADGTPNRELPSSGGDRPPGP